MAKANRECYTCGQLYYYCPTCPSETKKETFYNMFCGERCSDIFKTLTDETFKRLTTTQCKDRLLGLNVSTNENFKEGVKNHIKRVFDYKEEPIVENIETVKVADEVKEQKTVDVIETETTEEVCIEEEIVEKEPVKKMEYVPKRNRKQKIVK